MNTTPLKGSVSKKALLLMLESEQRRRKELEGVLRELLETGIRIDQQVPAIKRAQLLLGIF